MHALADRDFCAALVLSLGHFLWQGTLIAGLAVLMTRRVTSSHLRCRRLVASLTLMALCPVVTIGIHLVKSGPSALPVVAKMTDPVVVPAGDGAIPQLASNGESPLTLKRHPIEVSADPLLTIAVSPVEQPILSTNAGWQRFAPLLMNVYLLGVAGMLLRLVAGLWGGWRLRVRSSPIEDVLL